MFFQTNETLVSFKDCGLELHIYIYEYRVFVKKYLAFKAIFLDFSEMSLYIVSIEIIPAYNKGILIKI